MREAFGYYVKGVSDHEHRELPPQEVYDLFRSRYVNVEAPLRPCRGALPADRRHHRARHGGVWRRQRQVTAQGNGRLDAVSNALHQLVGDYVLSTYTEHALETGAKSQAASYVGIETPDGKTYWGAGVDSDIILSSVYALVSAGQPHARRARRAAVRRRSPVLKGANPCRKQASDRPGDLIEQGVTDVFGYPGGQVLSIYDAFYEYRDRIRHVLAAHEQGAAHAADGYARATGKVGVVIAHVRPGRDEPGHGHRYGHARLGAAGRHHGERAARSRSGATRSRRWTSPASRCTSPSTTILSTT